MKSQAIGVCVIAGGLTLVGILMFRSSQAQEAEGLAGEAAYKRQAEEFKRQAEEFKRREWELKDRVKIKANAAAAHMKMNIMRQLGEPDAMRAIRDAAKALSAAEGVEAKSKAQQELASVLDKYFEADMSRREEELAKIEERLKSLRALLEKRRARKREIIDLQIQVALNEAEGLGFFTDGQPTGPGTMSGFFMGDSDVPGEGEFRIGPPSPYNPFGAPTPIRVEAQGTASAAAASEPFAEPQPPADPDPEPEPDDVPR